MADSFANVGTPVDNFASVGKPVDSFATVGKPVDSFDSVGKPVQQDKSIFQKAVGASKSIIDTTATGINEAAGLADTVAGYAVGAAGLLTDVGLMAKGEFENITRPEGQAPDKHVLKEARESSEAGLAAVPALSHPIKSLIDSMGLEKKDGKASPTMAEQFGEWTGEKIDRAAKFWEEKTGSETVGETLRLGANAAQYALEPVAKVGKAGWDKVGEAVSKAKEDMVSLEKVKEREQLLRHQKEVESEIAAKKKAEEEDAAWKQYKAQQDADIKDEKDNAFRQAETLSELKTRLQVEQMWKDKQIAEDQARAAKGEATPTDAIRHDMEDYTNPAKRDMALADAQRAGVQVFFDENGRIDPHKTKVSWDVLDKFKTVGEFLNHVTEHLPIIYQKWVSRLQGTADPFAFKTGDYESKERGHQASSPVWGTDSEGKQVAHEIGRAHV